MCAGDQGLPGAQTGWWWWGVRSAAASRHEGRLAMAPPTVELPSCGGRPGSNAVAGLPWPQAPTWAPRSTCESRGIPRLRTCSWRGPASPPGTHCRGRLDKGGRFHVSVLVSVSAVL